jgi:hypothetical protein
MSACAARYIYSLYWATTTLATVGYGDFSAANPAEAVWATIYMFFNLALGAYVLGTITLLVVKTDERTGRYRDMSQNLKQYNQVNEIPQVRGPHNVPGGACPAAARSLRGPWKGQGSLTVHELCTARLQCSSAAAQGQTGRMTRSTGQRLC